MSNQLPNGLWSDFNPKEDGRLKANANFHQLDWSQWKCIKEQIILADLPVSGAVGDAYLVDDTTVHIWYNAQWNVITPHCTFLYFDETLNEFFVWIAGVSTELSDYVSVMDNTPVGVIHIFDDYGILSLPPGYVWCDGALITGGPLNGLNARDLSGLAIVGYGAIGAGDIDTAAYDAAPVGNVGNEINIAHTHNVDSHTHTFVHTHEHTHTHSDGNLYAGIGEETGGTNRIVVKQTGITFSSTDRWATGGIGMDSTNSSSPNAVDVEGDTGPADDATTNSQSTSTTGAASPATDSSLSATQNIQPRSAKVRFILKVT